MAKLKVIGSSSSGNSYILDCGNEILLIELGVSWDKIIKGLNYGEGFRKLKGCLISHKHSDHLSPNTIKKAISRGLRVYSCQEVQDIHPKVNVLKLGHISRIGGFSVQPLLVPHNAECYAYIIKHKDFGKLVFATDCSAFPYKIKDVNHWLIEANYSDDIIIDKMCDNTYSQSASENHMEINRTIDVLKLNKSVSLQNVILIHLSDNNSNAEEFVKRVKNEVGFPYVYVANKGDEFDLNESEF